MRSDGSQRVNDKYRKQRLFLPFGAVPAATGGAVRGIEALAPAPPLRDGVKRREWSTLGPRERGRFISWSVKTLM